MSFFWYLLDQLQLLRMPSSLGTPGECLHKFVFRTLHFVVRPEKPASEELCYRLISHIDPAGFLCCWTSCCCTPRVRALLLNTFAQLLSVDDSSPSSSTSCFTCLFFRARLATHMHFTMYCAASSLSPCGLVLLRYVLFPCFFTVFLCVTLACRASSMFANSMIFIGSRPQTRWRCGSLKSHQFATARDFLVV